MNRLTWGSDGLSGSASSSSGTDPSLSDSLQEANMEPTQAHIQHIHKYMQMKCNISLLPYKLITVIEGMRALLSSLALH